MRKRLFAAVVLVSAYLNAQDASPAPAGTYRIAGVVVDEVTGRTVPMARMALLGDVVKAETSRSTFSDIDGRFVFEGLTAGGYGLYAEAADYPSQGFEEHLPLMTGVMVGAGVDEQAQHLVFKLHHPCVISGTVTDEANEPVRDADVLLFFRSPITLDQVRPIRSIKTDDLGRYRFPVPFNGELFVAVSAQPWYAKVDWSSTLAGPYMRNHPSNRELDVAYPLTYYPGVTDSAEATPIPIHRGEQVTADIVLHPEPALKLTLLRKAGGESPRPSEKLMQPTFGENEIPIKTSPIYGGRGEGPMFGGIAPGRYLLRSHSEPQGEQKGESLDHVRELYLSSDTSIDPDSHELSGLATITGKVEDRKASLDKLYYVFIFGTSGGRRRLARIDDDGNFKFDGVPPGDYDLLVDASKEFYVEHVRSGNVTTQHSFTVVPSLPVTLSVSFKKGIAHVAGNVSFGGKPLSGVLIMLAPVKEQSPDLLRVDQSNLDGSFELKNVIPGDYLVYAVRDGFDMNRKTLQEKYRARAVFVHIGPSDDVKLKVEAQ